MGDGPIFFMAFMCSDVPYPLFYLKEYPGNIKSNFSMILSLLTFATIEAEAIDIESESPFIMERTGIPRSKRKFPSSKIISGTTGIFFRSFFIANSVAALTFILSITRWDTRVWAARYECLSINFKALFRPDGVSFFESRMLLRISIWGLFINVSLYITRPTERCPASAPLPASSMPAIML